LEIDLFIVRYEPSSEQEKPAWGVAGIKPTTRSIPAGQLPAGAIVGRNEFGQDRYSVCPAHGTTAEYIVVLDALPRKLPVQPGFATEAVLSRAVHSANHEGELNLTYHRP
jgi:phosphatidylethanolamine-binding protein (PEBP) family uncharacterized protein